MTQMNSIDERWSFRALFWLGVVVSVVLVVAHQSRHGLRPTERVDDVDREPDAREG